MRTNFLMAAATLVFVLSSCGNTAQKNSSESAETNLDTNITKTENSMTTTKKTIQLTRAEFLTKVANFEENPDKWVYLGDKPCIIDFYADWCGPCKMISPILEELASEYDGEIYIYKVDTEAEQQLAAEFGIRSIPSLLFVPMDEAPQMAQGALPKDAFKQAIEEVLLKKS
ncbi:thioredoxin [Proteiniphilum acetatigenes]|uniref:thioredoxin n=1 Tax=Proteiniphilum acetatigenes TaxID=294710 RepID=UPI0004761246|nr:thioredoxin [Proteiniphilum acetatigenes]SFK26588.1 thioredoxin [Porphyromonadaceae bacterium KH3CP3RA]